MSDETTTAAESSTADSPPAAAAEHPEPAADRPESSPGSVAVLPEAPAESEAEPGTPEVAAEEPTPEAEPESVSEPEPEGEAAPVTAAVEVPADAEAGEPAPALVPESKKKWYVIKVQSGREDTIKAAIERKVRIEGLEEFFGQIMVPYEEFVEKKSVRAKVKNKKTGEVETVMQEKNVVKKRKKFHGYIFAEVEFNDRILYLFRETRGVGDFVGGGGPLKPPAPMDELEVRKMLGEAVKGEGKPKQVVKLDYEKGDRVRVKDGAFSGSEAEVKAITLPKDPTDTPKVTVVVTIWGRPVEMEMDYWHVEKL